MNTMNDERFFDLAMKVIAQQATDAERTELNSSMVEDPNRKAEFEGLQTATKLAKDVVPLLEATESTAGEFPMYARGRLQTKVRETLGAHPTTRQGTEKKAPRRWQWVLGIAATTVVVLILFIPIFTPADKMIVQVAMLDSAGSTRGENGDELTILQKLERAGTVQSFSQSNELAAWENSWPGKPTQPSVKIIYDRTAGEIRVSGRWKGEPFQQTFLVERDLETTLREAENFIREQTGNGRRKN